MDRLNAENISRCTVFIMIVWLHKSSSSVYNMQNSSEVYNLVRLVITIHLIYFHLLLESTVLWALTILYFFLRTLRFEK